MSSQPSVSITEQPAGKQQRFRYLSEVDGARSVGSIPGVNSTADRKTFPSIRVHGYKGPFVVLLSLLNPDNYLVHPHSITGSDPRYSCKHGVIFVLSEEPDVVFKNIGILCVKGKTEKDVKSALKMRKLMDIDPFRAGFPHLYDHRQIDFTAVRLCFQVLLPGPDWTPAERNNLKKYTRSLPAVVSDVVYDAKKLNDLKIVYINSCAGPTSGGTEMTLLCDKYTGQNPDVVFEDERGWTQTATVKIYHKQLAIVFVAPPYRDHQDRGNIKVRVYLQQTHEQPNGQLRVLRSHPAIVEYLPYDRKGSPLKFPTPPQSEKSNISLKKVRIQQRPCPGDGDPEDGRSKRWRPWGRGEAPPDPSTTDSEEDHISSDQIAQIYIRELTNTAPGRIDIDERSEVIPLFDPKNPELQAHEWISTIDQLGNEFNWSDPVKSYYMQKRLIGTGKDWLSTLRHTDSWTWLEWKEKLLEAFPRKVDYVDLLKDMLAQRKTKSERVRFNNKHPLPARHEINAKKAYACLVEGWPLQMKTPTHYERHESHHLLHPNYAHLLDRVDLQNNAPQIHPINLNKDDHMNALNIQDDVKPIFPNTVNYRFDDNGHDDQRRFCCCNEQKARVIRHCPPSRQNEMRPSCIIQRNHRPLEKSWHQPCSTLTSSASSPSISNPAPDWFMHQKFIKYRHARPPRANFQFYTTLDEDRHYRRSIITGFEAPSYLGNIARKNEGRGESGNTRAYAHYHAASSASASSTQPHDLKYEFKTSPSSCQEYRPSGDVAELGYNPLYAHMPCTSRQINSINVVHEINLNNMIFDKNIQGSRDPHVANVNRNNFNQLSSASGVNNVEPAFMYRFPTVIPAGSKVKRENHKGPDSGELPAKREKPMLTDLEALLSHRSDITPTHVNSNPFIDTNRVPQILNEFTTPAACLPTEENVTHDSALCTEEVLKLVLDRFGPDVMIDITNAVAEGDQWHRERVNTPYVHQSVIQPLQHEHAIPSNVAQNRTAANIIPDNNLNIDQPDNVDRVECVSEEMRKMKFDG